MVLHPIIDEYLLFITNYLIKNLTCKFLAPNCFLLFLAERYVVSFFFEKITLKNLEKKLRLSNKFTFLNVFLSISKES